MLTLLTRYGIRNVVRTIKPIEKLTIRTLELFEIERIYFAELGIDWCIVTEDKIPGNLVKNVEWMAHAKYLDIQQVVNEELIELVSDDIYEIFIKDSARTSIMNLCIRTDKAMGLTKGTCLFILQYMLANKNWETEMSKRIIRESEPLTIFKNETQKKIIHLA